MFLKGWEYILRESVWWSMIVKQVMRRGKTRGTEENNKMRIRTEDSKYDLKKEIINTGEEENEIRGRINREKK